MDTSSNALALIPARGGSKAIPNKNLQKVGGVPLIARTVKSALASKRVCRVVVSTDDYKIATTAKDAGAEVVHRPSSISGDTASTESALLHALSTLEIEGPLPMTLALLQCTSPFTRASDIDLVLSALDKKGINSSFAVVPWHGFLWSADGIGINHNPNQLRQRRQDLDQAFLETGAIYAMNISAFRANRNRFCPQWMPVVIDSVGPEIDTSVDLEICRNIAASMRE